MSLLKSHIAKILSHPWVVAVSNWLLVMAVFSASRLFYYLTNLGTYPDVTASHLWEMMVGGLRFDLTASLYLNSVYLLMQLMPFRFRGNTVYQHVAQWFFWIPNSLAIAVNCADMVYMQFTGRRTTIAFFSEFQHDSNLARIFFTSAVQYWYVTLFGVAMIVLLVVLTRRRVTTDDSRKPIVYYATESVLFIVSIYLIVIGIRGGFGAFTRPITLSNALQYTNRPAEANIVLNTPFSLMRSTEGEVFHEMRYFADEERDAIMMPVRHGKGLHLTGGRKMNVVVIILESFSKEYIGYFNRQLDGGTYTGYTPFLDSLAAHSLTFPLSLACGRKSIDAMPSVLSSIPMLISPYILTPYSTNTVASIASYLGEEGYSTAFFHGAPNGSMGFLAYARSCGFQAYYGKDEYHNDADYDGYWAIWDEEFMQYFGRTMSTMSEPFMTALFTATSHHPFQVPDRYKGVFPEGTHPLHPCIGYTDHALRAFFAFARTQPWYDHTLFVLTADHTNVLTHPEYTNDKGLYEVPVLFFDPHMDEALRTRERNYPVAQTDILPSVLEYTGYDKPYFAFGEDVLTGDKTAPYVVNYNTPLFQIYSDSLLLQFDGSEITGLYDFRSDPLLRHNIKDDNLRVRDTQAMLRYLKAFIQQYTTRMINNQLTYGSTD